MDRLQWELFEDGLVGLVEMIVAFRDERRYCESSVSITLDILMKLKCQRIQSPPNNNTQGYFLHLPGAPWRYRLRLVSSGVVEGVGNTVGDVVLQLSKI